MTSGSSKNSLKYSLTEPTVASSGVPMFISRTPLFTTNSTLQDLVIIVSFRNSVFENNISIEQINMVTAVEQN